MSESPSSEEKDDERSDCEVCGGVGVDFDDDVEGEVGKSSDEEDMLSLEVCWGAGMLVGDDNESIVLVELMSLVVVLLTCRLVPVGELLYEYGE
jgi:hypothetical protein